MNRSDIAKPRTPEPARPPRMARLAMLPLFFKLYGKRVVVVGGNAAASWKAELLSAAGANIEVWAPDPCAEMEALAAEPPGGTIALKRSAWCPACFVDADMIVGAAEDAAEARRIFLAARQAGVLVNVIDRPTFCSFQFGAIVNRSPLVVGISTDGAAPVFGQAIRSRIEALLPAGFARWAQTAKAWRGELQGLQLGSAMRRRFWERFATLALREPQRTPGRQDLDQLLTEARGGADSMQGCVSLVGAGPGNPELLTLAAVRALRSADVILYDDLVAREILDFARREAKRMLVGKTGRRPSCRQDDINALMISLAKSGKRVVRLKAGDPMIFGRGGEEIAALQRGDIPFDVVPGVTAAQGAAASLKVSLTHRGGARRLQFVTGHADDGRLPMDVDPAALADPTATTAVYMPLGTLDALTERLLAAGVERGLAVYAIFNATRADERIVTGTLASIQERIRATSVRGPCVLLFGKGLNSIEQAARAQSVPSPNTAQSGADPIVNRWGG